MANEKLHCHDVICVSSSLLWFDIDLSHATGYGPDFVSNRHCVHEQVLVTLLFNLGIELYFVFAGRPDTRGHLDVFDTHLNVAKLLKQVRVLEHLAHDQGVVINISFARYGVGIDKLSEVCDFAGIWNLFKVLFWQVQLDLDISCRRWVDRLQRDGKLAVSRHKSV